MSFWGFSPEINILYALYLHVGLTIKAIKTSATSELLSNPSEMAKYRAMCISWIIWQLMSYPCSEHEEEAQRGSDQPQKVHELPHFMMNCT